MALVIVATLSSCGRPGALRPCRASTDTGTSSRPGLSGLAIGVYDGAIGPGTGTFLVFALVGLIGLDFLPASGSAKIANAATNLGALLVFVPQGAALWRLGLVMGGRQRRGVAGCPDARWPEGAGSSGWSSSSSRRR